MGSLASHCYDVLKEQGAYDNFQKADKNGQIVYDNFEKRSKSESDIPYFPNPEIVKHPEVPIIISDFSYIYSHEPHLENLEVPDNISDLAFKQYPVISADDAL